MMREKPTHEQLVAFAAGELNDSDAAWISGYLATDAQAAREVATLQAILGAMRSDRSQAAPLESVANAKSIFRPRAAVAGESWWQRATRAVAELVFDSRMQPALAGFRSSGGEGFQLEFEKDGARVDLQFEPRGEERASWHLIGQVSAAPADPNAEVAVLAQGADQIIREAAADDSGIFTLEIDRGDYDICVRMKDRVMVLPGIRIE